MDYRRFYKQLFQPIEERIGAIDAATRMPLIGFDAGGPISLCTVGYGREPFVTYVTCELSVRKNQHPAACGRFEAMMTCDDERWAREILTNVGRMSLETVIDQGHTIDIGPVVGDQHVLQGLVVEEFARVSIDGESCGIQYFHGVTRSELQFAIASGTAELLKSLRKADVYPRTSVQRRESFAMVA